MLADGTATVAETACCRRQFAPISCRVGDVQKWLPAGRVMVVKGAVAIEERQGRLKVLDRLAARIGVAASAKCRRTIGDSMRFGGKAARDRGGRTGHGIVGRGVAALSSTGSCTEVLFYVIKPYRLGKQMS